MAAVSLSDAISAICAARRSGKSAADSAAAGGIHVRTLNYWLSRGRAGDSFFAPFAVAYDAASDVAIDMRRRSVSAAAERERQVAEAALAGENLQRAG